jgi:hypothetical protein
MAGRQTVISAFAGITRRLWITLAFVVTAFPATAFALGHRALPNPRLRRRTAHLQQAQDRCTPLLRGARLLPLSRGFSAGSVNQTQALLPPARPCNPSRGVLATAGALIAPGFLPQMPRGPATSRGSGHPSMPDIDGGRVGHAVRDFPAAIIGFAFDSACAGRKRASGAMD